MYGKRRVYPRLVAKVACSNLFLSCFGEGGGGDEVETQYVLVD